MATKFSGMRPLGPLNYVEKKILLALINSIGHGNGLLKIIYFITIPAQDVKKNHVTNTKRDFDISRKKIKLK